MFFDSGSFGQPSITMHTIKGWATAVCDQHLGAGADPTDCLVKVASSQGLTPPQVEVLACEINKTIHTAKYASAEEKYHAADFPLANAKEALAKLQAPSGTEKVAVEMPDPIRTAEDNFFSDAFGIEPGAIVKTASEQAPDATERKHFEKLSKLQRMQNDSYEMAKYAEAGSEAAYFSEVRGHVLQGMNSSDRLLKLGEAVHAARCAGKLDAAKKPLSKVAVSLGMEGLIDRDKSEGTANYLLKQADEKAPDYLISDWVEAKVVNGNHPLIVKLQTYCDDIERTHLELSRRNICDDQVRIFKQKMRAL